jgi:hypothetical protein
MKKIGPRMAAIIEYVRENPGCSMRAAAMHTRGIHTYGHQSGYNAAHRAIRAGLIVATRGERNSYRLEVAS